jgi:hypothetical protein
LDSFIPPGSDGSDPGLDVAGVEEKVDKLAAYLHLEWCNNCGDWRDQGHVDHSGKAGVRQAILEEQDFPG